MKVFFGLVLGLGGFLAMAGSALAVRFSVLTTIILSILNILGVITIAWFAGPFTAGAISTGIWMFVLGIICVVIGGIITAAGAAILDDA